MLPIYVMYDTKIDKTERKAIADGIELIRDLAPGRIIMNLETGSQQNDYSSADWYLRNSGRKMLGRRIGVVAEDILSLFDEEPLREVYPRFTLLLTSKALILNDKRVTDATGGMVTVISLAAYKKAATQDRYAAVKARLLHGFGHVIGIPDFGRNDLKCILDDYSYVIEYHCADPNCIMHDEDDPIEWIYFARKLERRKKSKIFCSNCLNDIDALDL